MYATVPDYIRDDQFKENEYKRLYEYSEADDEKYLAEVIQDYGDLPAREAKCQYLSKVREEFYKNIVHVEPTATTANPSTGLMKLYQQMFYDSGVMIHLQCVLNRLFGDSILAEISPLWKQGIDRIGDKSADGMVYTGTIAGYDQFVVFKVAKAGTENETKYENLVGHLVNKLRLGGCLNFAYTYGVAECGSRDSYCKAGQLVIMQEFIKGTSAANFVKTATPKQFISHIGQLAKSLKQAQDTLGFRHIDLHNQNVMDRPYGNGEPFLLSYDDGTFIEATSIATVIDFGRSVVSINNELLVSGHTYDRDGEVLSMVCDMFKFLNFLYYDAVTNNFSGYDPEVIRMLVAMIQFFITDISGNNDVGAFRDTFYILPESSRDKTYTEFINHLGTNPVLKPWYDQVVTRSSEGRLVLSCSQTCSTPNSYVHYNQLNTVTSPLDFMIRVNEGWGIQLTQPEYDRLTDDIVRFVNDNKGKIPGVMKLVNGVINSIHGENNKQRLRELVATTGF